LLDEFGYSRLQAFAPHSFSAGVQEKRAFSQALVTGQQTLRVQNLLEPLFNCLSIVFNSRYQKGPGTRNSGCNPSHSKPIREG